MDQFLCKRITDWNKARYTRKYNHTLFVNMLHEEYGEYTEATTNGLLINKLDGLADLYFISIGALWKLNVNPYKYLERHMFLLEYDKFKSQHLVLNHTINTIVKTEDKDKLKHNIAMLSGLITKEALYIGCTIADFRTAINIICDSNDTKKLVKLKDHDKGTLKGVDFIPPFEQLTHLAEVINERNKKV